MEPESRTQREVDGGTVPRTATAKDQALTQTPTATDLALSDTAAATVSKPDTATDKPKRKAPRSAFVAGYDPRRNVSGRPRKGESYRDLYMKELDRHAPALVAAHIKRAQGQGVVAERAFALGAAYKLGQPRQTFVVEQGESPLLQFLAFAREQEQAPQQAYIEDAAQLLPAPGAAASDLP